MNVTVILEKPMNFGEGLDYRVTFNSAKYHTETDEQGGRLHIQPDPPGTSGQAGNIATFQRGEWRSVVRGNITATAAATSVESD